MKSAAMIVAFATAWQWGNAHKLSLRHPLGKPDFDLPPVARSGDANTVNTTSGANFAQTNGASWGDPVGRDYGDLLQDWAARRYHPLPYSHNAVVAAMQERIVLLP